MALLRKNETPWNEDQKKAIDGFGGTILVSAAAGSGKTAVLVERVIRKLADEEKPCDIERLLIVTFTKAAASQMKVKISKALSELISDNPDKKALKRNLFMLPYANISTIDSFCINLVRENFHALDISPDFLIADSALEEILKAKALEETIEKYHTEKSEEFRVLNKLINDNKSTDTIKEIIENLYTLSLAYVYPEEWLNDLYVNYADIKPLDETEAAISVKKSARSYIEKCIKKVEKKLSEIESEIFYEGENKKAAEIYKDAYESDIEVLKEFIDVLDNGTWDEITEYALNIGSKFKIRKQVRPATSFSNECSKLRELYHKKGVIPNKFNQLYFSEQDYIDSVTLTAPSVRLLTDVVLDYGSRLMELKNEKNAYSFDDVRHFTLQLLTDKVDGKPVKSQLAYDLSKNYDEILVDEYQDVSEAQDTIFRMLSDNDTNRFMVGDVKQSIYGFRQAMPEVFTDLRDNMHEFDYKSYPAKIALSSNYRSREGVTEAANFIFEQMMTRKAGGVDYEGPELLNAEASYPDREAKESDFEIILIEEKEEKTKRQAEQIAEYIKKTIAAKKKFGAPGKEKEATYSDFCILKRSRGTGGKDFRIFAKVFENAGIPLAVSAQSSYLETPEIRFIISLLKIIDNPLDDVSLVTVMMSPVYGFTPDEMAGMRIHDRKSNVYKCLVKSAEEGNRKSSEFVATLKKLRRIAVTRPAGEFTSDIIDDTGYRAICSAMKNGDARNANLNAFISLAVSYEKTGVKGISGFLRFLDKLEKSKPESPKAGIASSDSVHLMTIHESKGLEFPVVFLACCEGQYYEKDLDKNLLVSRKTGLGLKWISNNVRYESFSRLAAKESKRAEGRSEELRLLYVALTRAKEKTVIVSAAQDWSSTLKNYSENVVKGENPAPETVLEMNSYSKIILTAMLKHPDAHALRNRAGLDAGISSKADFSISAEIIPQKENDITSDTNVIDEPEYEPDDELLKTLSERLSYVYPFEALNGITAKRIASDMEEEGFDENYFASAKPAFSNNNNITPAQKGTAVHRFMQYADFTSASINPGLEAKRMVKEEILTAQEAKSIEIDHIKGFFSSELAKRIMEAEKLGNVYREYGFTVQLPLKNVYPDIPDKVSENETALIEGVADCAFVENGKLIIVDYKTDHAVTGNELIKKYKPQLVTYSRCLSLALNMEVSEMIIYSFCLGKEIPVE